METYFSKMLLIGFAVSSYWFVSITLVFLNKYLLSSEDLKLNAPLFITWYQCIVTVLLCAGLSIASKLYPNKITFPDFAIKKEVLLQVLPLSIVFVAMITFNNMCLKHVGVSFYYVGRSLTTVFNVILTYFLLGQKTSISVIVCCCVIIFGFFLGVDQESSIGSLSLMGVIFGVGASLCVALYSIYTKKVLPFVDENIWKLTMYNNINAVLLFIPLMLVFGEMQEVYNFKNLYQISFWFYMTIGGVFGFAIGYFTGLQIQVTSPLTHNISGTAKACAQTVMATTFFNEVKTSLWWCSNMTVLFGSLAYAFVRQKEMKAKHTEDVKAEKDPVIPKYEKLKNSPSQ